MSIIVAFIIMIGFLVLSIYTWRTSKLVSLLILSPFLLVVLYVGYVVYQSWYHTTPDSLSFTVDKENQSYTVTGVWEKPLDAYRFSTDFIVFYVPDDEKVTNVQRERVEDYENMDMDYVEGSLQEWMELGDSPEAVPQVFDIKTAKKFNFSFVLPENVEPNEVALYYVHAREEPMETLEFWYKKVELE